MLLTTFSKICVFKSIDQSVCPSTDQSVCPSTDQSVCPSTDRSVCPRLGYAEPFQRQLASWCFEPRQPLAVTSGLNTNSNPASYSAHKSFNINHNISTAQLFQTYRHEHTQNHTYFYKITNFLRHS